MDFIKIKKSLSNDATLTEIVDAYLDGFKCEAIEIGWSNPEVVTKSIMVVVENQISKLKTSPNKKVKYETDASNYDPYTRLEKVRIKNACKNFFKRFLQEFIQVLKSFKNDGNNWLDITAIIKPITSIDWDDIKISPKSITDASSKTCSCKQCDKLREEAGLPPLEKHATRKWHDYDVDFNLKDEWLIALNNVPGFDLISICEGHEGEDNAHFNLRANSKIEYSHVADLVDDLKPVYRDIISVPNTWCDIVIWNIKNEVLYENYKYNAAKAEKPTKLTFRIFCSLKNSHSNEDTIEKWWSNITTKVKMLSSIKFIEKSTKGNDAEAQPMYENLPKYGAKAMKELLAKHGIKVKNGQISRSSFNKAVEVLSCNMPFLLLEGKKLNDEFAKLYADESKKDIVTPSLLNDGIAPEKQLDKSYKDQSKQKIKEKMEELVVKKPESKELDSLYKAKADLLLRRGYLGELRQKLIEIKSEMTSFSDELEDANTDQKDNDIIELARKISADLESLYSNFNADSKDIDILEDAEAKITKACTMKDLLLEGKDLETKKLDKLLVSGKKDKTMKGLTDTKEVLEDELAKVYSGKEKQKIEEKIKELVVDSKVPLKEKDFYAKASKRKTTASDLYKEQVKLIREIGSALNIACKAAEVYAEWLNHNEVQEIMSSEASNVSEKVKEQANRILEIV